MERERAMGKPAVATQRRIRPESSRLLGILLLLSLVVPVSSRAMEVSGLIGATVPDHGEESTYGWQVDIRHALTGFLALSVSWINEGHLPGHRRDGPAALFWVRTPPWGRPVSLAVGTGIYRYFDTQTLPGGDYDNVHGWAKVYSLSISYATETPWFFQLTANHLDPGGQADTSVFLAGLGYRFKSPLEGSAPGPATSPPHRTGNEVTPFLGISVQNRPGNRQGVARGVEVRRGISEHLDVTVSWIGENNGEEIRRKGIGSQIWLVDNVFAGRLVLGIGAGPYAFHDSRPPEKEHGHTELAGLVTFTAGYRFSEHGIGRFQWIRVMTDTDRDSDVFVLGAGYRWSQ
jgi:hypothetical protein